MRGSDQTSSRARLLAAAALACACVGVVTMPALARGGSDPSAERRGVAGDGAVQRQPLGVARTGGDLRLSRQKLLAGRPGQRLRVGYRLGRAHRGARLRVILRRVRREDPRHPGTTIGGEIERRAAARPRGRHLSVLLDRLGPEPGPHRVILQRRGDRAPARIATARISVLPQGRVPTATGDPAGATGDRRSTDDPDRRRRSIVGGDVPHDLSFRPGSEASSAIALERDDPDRGIAATNDADEGPLAFVSSESFASGSVRERELPGLTELPGGGTVTREICCEPDVAADAAGNLWMAASTSGGDGRIVVNRVAAGSSAFAGASAGLPISGASTAQQKPAIAVLDSVSIAAVWIETAGGAQNVVYSGCDLSGAVADCDDPDNWSAPDPVTDASGLYSMPDLAFAPNGDLYAVWWDAGSDDSGGDDAASANAVEIDRCLSGEFASGQCTAGSWDEGAEIADLDLFDDDGGGPDPLPLFCPIIAAPGGLVGPSPSVEIGPAGNVFIAHSDLRENADVGSPSRCTASGSDKTFDSFVTAGAVPNTIPAANTGVRLSADGPLELNDHFLPALSTDPSSGEVEATFNTTAGDPGGQSSKRVYVSSGDLGLTYSAPAQVGNGDSRFAGALSDGIDYGDRQGGDSAAGSFRPAWTDAGPRQGSDPDLYVLGAQVEATIDEGPDGTVAENEGAVTFSTEAVRTECAVVAVTATEACASPYGYGPLVNGSYTIQIRPTDLAGNLMDLSPPSVTFTVADLTPPETTLTSSPPRKSKKKRPKFEFTSTEPNSKFECRFDKKPWDNCKSPKRKKVTPGKHRFRVRAKDFTGNVDPTPVKYRFERKRKRSVR